jgi:PAS domain S-box-containing protein
MLMLGLMPLLVAFPIVIGILTAVADKQTLLKSSLRGNLAGARNYLELLKTQNSKRIEQLVRLDVLQKEVRQVTGQAPDRLALNKALQTAAENSGLDYLLVVADDRRILGSSTGAIAGQLLPDSYVIRQAHIGVTSATYEKFTLEQLRAFSPDFSEQLRLSPSETGSETVFSSHGLLINAAAHFPLSLSMPDLILVGGTLLNRNHSLTDHMREIIFPIGALLDNAEGVTAIYLDDLSIAVSVQRNEGARLLGRSAPPEVLQTVIEQGQRWLGELDYDGASYMAGFEALQDGNGQRVGMISVSFPREPYQRVLRWVMTGISLLLALVMLAISLLFLRFGHALTLRLERMGDTMKAVHRGDRQARVLLQGKRDELEQLGLNFNELLDTIAEQEARQRRSQEVIANEAARRHALFSHASDGILICDARGRVVECNPKAAALLGYTRQQLTGRYLHEWEIPYSADEIRQLIEQVDAAGSSYETQHQRQDGSRYFAEVSLSRAQWAGQTFVLALLRDISERKAVEAELENYRKSLELRTSELAAANEAKNEFLANMSHEIRTPMGVVIGLSNLLLDSELVPEQRDYLEKIHMASTALLGVLNDILDHSKIESRLLQVESIPMCVADVLHKSEALFAIRAQQQQLALSVECDPELPEVLLGDPLRLLQVLNNLIGNALKFTERGSIRVKAECLERGPDAVLLKVSVTDTGVGMLPAHMERLFTAFQQADASTSRYYGGTGLGLSISKGLVELMQGEIGVSSKMGEGSTFWFTLRLGVASQAAGEVVLTAGPRASFAAADARNRLSPMAERAVPIRGARVLVVDDNAVNLLVAGAYLRKMGLLAETVDSGRAALEQLQRQHFDAILLDLQMPVLDGFATARAIRATEAGRSIPIIALTAAARLSDRQAAQAAGMNDHIAKPIDPLQLADTLVKWIAPAAHQADLPATVRPEPVAPVVFDLGLALQQLDGDRELLQAVLASFVEQFTPAAAQLAESLQQQQFKDAARLVHTIKGLAPTLGAQALQQVAQRFEAALERQDLSLLPAFNQALAAVLAAIAAALTAAPQSPEPGSAVDGER